MSHATRVASKGKSPLYIFEPEGDIVLASDFAAVTNWTAQDASGNLAADATDAIDLDQGASVGWDKTGTGSVSARITLAAGSAVDLSDGAWRSMYLKSPSDLADVDQLVIRVGSSAADYGEWIIPDSWWTAATWKRTKLDDTYQESGWSYSETGTPDWSAVDFVEIDWQADAAGDTFSGMRVATLRNHQNRVSTGRITTPRATTKEGWARIPSVSESVWSPRDGTLGMATASTRVVDGDGTTFITDMSNFEPQRRRWTVYQGFRGDAETEENYAAIFQGELESGVHAGKAWDISIADNLRAMDVPFAQAASTGSPYTITGTILEVFLNLFCSTGNGCNQGNLSTNYDTEAAGQGAGLSALLLSPEIETVLASFGGSDDCSFTFREPQTSLRKFFQEEVCRGYGYAPVLTSEGLISVRAVEAGVYPSATRAEVGDANIILDQQVPPVGLNADRIRNQIRMLTDYNSSTKVYATDSQDSYQDANSISTYGVRELVIKSKGITSSTVANRVARRYLAMLAEGAPPVRVETFMTLQQEVVGNLVDLSSTRRIPDIKAGTYSLSSALAQIERRHPNHAAQRMGFTFGQTGYNAGNYRLIGTAGMSSYDSQTTIQQLTYGSFADGSGLLGTANDPAHVWGP